MPEIPSHQALIAAKYSPNPTIDLWEQQEGETLQQFALFVQYRDHNHLTSEKAVIREIAQKNGLEMTAVQNWSSKWRWEERARLWEQEKDRIRLKVQLDQVTQMYSRQAAIAVGIQQKVANRLKDMIEAEITPGQLATLFKVAVEVERTARGEPADARQVSLTAQVNHDVNVTNTSAPAHDLSSLSLEELEALEKLLLKTNTKAHVHRNGHGHAEIIDVEPLPKPNGIAEPTAAGEPEPVPAKRPRGRPRKHPAETG